MQFLRLQLDDPFAAPCGRCDNCGGTSVSSRTDAATVETAQSRLSRPGVTLDPRRQWPAAMKALGVPLSGRIPSERTAEPGRAIARFTDLGFGSRVRETAGSDRVDEQVPDDLLRAAVRVLAAWDWSQRPAAVVSVGSGTHSRLIRSLAEGLARIGRLPYFGEIPHSGPAGARRSNSAQRLRAVYGAYQVPDEMLQAMTGQPILLIDDRIGTGWTLTIVAYLLREAGAGQVYPFVLGVES